LSVFTASPIHECLARLCGDAAIIDTFVRQKNQKRTCVSVFFNAIIRERATMRAIAVHSRESILWSASC